MTVQGDLVERIREELMGRDVQELTMFGGVSFMIEDRMVVAARRDGDLLLRIDPSGREALLTEPGAQPAVMGAGRPMGPGWLSVRPEALVGSGLRTWLDHALAFHTAQSGSSAGER